MLSKVNIELTESFIVHCPHCGDRQSAPFNYDNPGEDLNYRCNECHEEFIVTFDEDLAREAYENEEDVNEIIEARKKQFEDLKK